MFLAVTTPVPNDTLGCTTVRKVWLQVYKTFDNKEKKLSTFVIDEPGVNGRGVQSRNYDNVVVSSIPWVEF